jgi:hypothetical protein
MLYIKLFWIFWLESLICRRSHTRCFISPRGRDIGNGTITRTLCHTVSDKWSPSYRLSLMLSWKCSRGTTSKTLTQPVYWTAGSWSRLPWTDPTVNWSRLRVILDELNCNINLAWLGYTLSTDYNIKSSQKTVKTLIDGSSSGIALWRQPLPLSSPLARLDKYTFVSLMSYHLFDESHTIYWFSSLWVSLSFVKHLATWN